MHLYCQFPNLKRLSNYGVISMSKEKAQLDLKPMSIRGTTVTLYQLMFLH